MPGGYAYDNDVDAAVQQHACLSAMLDDFTKARLSTVDAYATAGPALGPFRGPDPVPDPAAGASTVADPAAGTDAFRCLEVGAGAGSIARWLADRGASVVATDLKPSHLSEDAGIQVLAHDIVADPVPDPPYDLVHARLLLLHLPERERVLRKLAAALRPGGSLVVEDWHVSVEHLVLDAPEPADVALFDRYQHALIGILDNDPTWATRIHAKMVAAGLRRVETAIHSPVWPAGSPGALLVTVNLALFRERLLDAGLTGGELDHLEWLVRDPRSGLVIRGHFLYSTIGHAPAP
ncbi:class I SAM-dependent methyltransferase [Phytohabitans sp. ZYX-F-186]|uniref:Class I SAM-dependent methyltransferase n=1 Tax=Phytohabitans maris TaxID=3071409 RepID=A0ABU0ZBB0_9ACTN|nr:class I SAM-dependent methyltransferase [Phytohabitans sp. ZYX-F-186]MDQ7904349.1 class I SAM-dependent methyltransferase [Phytohabitans sp. ZYX-F-186]